MIYSQSPQGAHKQCLSVFTPRGIISVVPVVRPLGALAFSWGPYSRNISTHDATFIVLVCQPFVFLFSLFLERISCLLRSNYQIFSDVMVVIVTKCEEDPSRKKYLLSRDQ